MVKAKKFLKLILFVFIIFFVFFLGTTIILSMQEKEITDPLVEAKKICNEKQMTLEEKEVDIKYSLKNDVLFTLIKDACLKSNYNSQEIAENRDNLDITTYKIKEKTYKGEDLYLSIIKNKKTNLVIGAFFEDKSKTSLNIISTADEIILEN